MDPDYKYALVAGGRLKYLEILSRETTIPDTIKQEYLHLANTPAYKTSDLKGRPATTTGINAFYLQVISCRAQYNLKEINIFNTVCLPDIVLII